MHMVFTNNNVTKGQCSFTYNSPTNSKLFGVALCIFPHNVREHVLVPLEPQPRTMTNGLSEIRRGVCAGRFTVEIFIC